MEFATWTEFFAMGGYARYVWPSYALSLGLLAVVLLQPVLRHRVLRRQLARLARRRDREARS
ncbi:MAG: heme exporter protein CcmD [Candidatus Competibacterales bacterium]|nr:heme exporter protein CcmD [Candidatus Competibacterales bacterium]